MQEEEFPRFLHAKLRYENISMTAELYGPLDGFRCTAPFYFASENFAGKF